MKEPSKKSKTVKPVKEKEKEPVQKKPAEKKSLLRKPAEKVPGAEPAGVDPWSVLLYPHLGEKSMGMVEFQNRLTFIVDRRATKGDIAKAIEEGFHVEVKKVNVEITMKGKKKAYITLTSKHSAADIATRLGMI